MAVLVWLELTRVEWPINLKSEIRLQTDYQNKQEYSVMYKKNILAIVMMFSLTGGMKAFAEDHVINAQARVFAPAILYIQSGDTVKWTNMPSHNTASIEGMIPDGADSWRSKMGDNFSITLTEEGVYSYVCEPHIGFGMVGAIIVGEPVNIDASMEYARENLKGPYRRILGKLIKIQRAAKKE